MSSWVLRRVTGVDQHEQGVTAHIDAAGAVPAGELGGWLTGEPLSRQGIQALPNLADITLPPATNRGFTLSVEFPRTDIVRLLLRPVDTWERASDPTWLGIVTDNHRLTDIDVRFDEAQTTLSTEHISVQLGHEPFGMSVVDKRTGNVTFRTAVSRRQATGLPLCPPVLIDHGHATIHLEADGDDITGFGEQFGRLVHNGKRLVLRCTDALGTATGYAYKPVPLWHSSSDHAVLLNTGATVTADVEHTTPGVLAVSTTDELLDLHVMVDAEPKRRLTAYTEITGRPTVPPPWSFGYWLGRCRYHSNTEMLGVAEKAREHDVPLDVVHCDPDWLRTDRLNCDFVWNEERFGDRARFVADLEQHGVRLSVWELPYLDPASSRYTEAHDGDHLVRDVTGEVVAMEGTPTPDDRHRAIVDLTSEHGRQWWQEAHQEFLDDGVAVFKTDFGEGVPDTSVLADGTPPAHAHNLFPLRYNAVVSDVIRRRTGRPSLVWARSGWAGSHRYPAQWGGDPESSVAGFRATVRGGLSFSLSAPGLWGHDVGGFFGEGTPELYVRWTQFGALSPMMRAHGLTAREPWYADEETLAQAREWIRLRYSLLPYLWQVAHEAETAGWPMMRPMGLEFPEDPIAGILDGQFFLGSSLLVAPVFDDGPGPVRRQVYLPAGRWTDLLTGEVQHGPAWHTLSVPLERMPVLVRDGSVIPRVDVEHARNVDDLATRAWTIHAYGNVGPHHRLVGFDRTLTELTFEGNTVSSRGSQVITSASHHHT